MADTARGGNHPQECDQVSDYGKYSSNLLYFLGINSLVIGNGYLGVYFLNSPSVWCKSICSPGVGLHAGARGNEGHHSTEPRLALHCTHDQSEQPLHCAPLNPC